MTPIERIIHDQMAAIRERQWYAESKWEREARKSVKAMADSARRSIGQLVRQARVRLNERG